jgi:uncharacterized protein YjiK
VNATLAHIRFPLRSRRALTRTLAVFCLLSLAVLHGRSQEKPAFLLASYRLADPEAPTVRLPGELREISGMATDGRGRIFCHNDEQGVVFRIDPDRGTILEKFSVGERVLRRDYEGIALADTVMYLVTSDGTLFEFSPSPPGGRAAPQTHRTGLSSGWDVEGLCYDPPTRSLLMACKENPSQKHLRCIYAYALQTRSLERAPRFTIDIRELQRTHGLRDFHPSGIERHPVSGSFFILSSSEPALLELSPSGKILGAVRLPGSLHRQPEGLAFGGDLTLYISNEGKNHGTVSRYRPAR